jgi:hypothetical protein
VSDLHPDNGQATNFGQSNSFPSTPVGATFVSQNEVQLISARVKKPTQWTITLQPMVRTDATTIPWATAGVDGQVGVVPTPANTTAPVLVPSTSFRCVLRWGAGGVAGETRFDYPYAGCVFSIVADNVDLKVIDPASATATYASQGQVPRFGAFMVPGTPGDVDPLTFGDVQSSTSQAIGQVAYWFIKPYARTVRINQLLIANAAQAFSVEILDGGGVPLVASFRYLDTGNGPPELPVPAGAEYLRVTNLTGGGGGQVFRPIWTIGLS